MIVPDVFLRARRQALMARHLVNWREVWSTYSSASPMPPLRFRNGMIIHHANRDSAGLLFFEIFANGCYRSGVPGVLSGDIVDIGANIGAFTLDAAMRYPTATVHAYEPDSCTCETLRQNVEENGLSSRVRIWNEAVAGEAGTLRLWQGEGSVLTSAYLDASARGVFRDVPAVTLETVVARASGRVGLLKMDCEGGEADILEAGGSALDAVDYLVAEYHVALVPDVLPRLRRVLEPSFDVTISDGRPCGSIIRAHRTRAPQRVAPTASRVVRLQAGGASVC
ncbi:MAG TPA: FkbM family methyltransferase [Vicinamibacterales bacterium]|nr:FkbM family methyltransferase [Vicinamibacterales bacterium]